MHHNAATARETDNLGDIGCSLVSLSSVFEDVCVWTDQVWNTTVVKVNPTVATSDHVSLSLNSVHDHVNGAVFSQAYVHTQQRTQHTTHKKRSTVTQ
jgi:hypothetical protein